MKIVQQAYRGRWRNVCGSPTDERDMTDYVARAVERDGYQSFRIGDDSTDGEHGAPMRPVHAFVPLADDEAREWLTLSARSAGQGEPLSEVDRQRLGALLRKTEGEVIGASDDHATEMAMQAAHRGGA